MRLDTYLGLDGKSASGLAREVRRYLPRGAKTTTPSTICRLLRSSDRKQQRTASLELALAIERATCGAVRAEDVPLSAEARRMLRVIRAVHPTPTEPDGDGAAAA